MIVRENINFQRGIDPKQAMGIGKGPWYNLKAGDILISNRSIYVSREGTLVNCPPYKFRDTKWAIASGTYFKITKIQQVRDGKRYIIEAVYGRDLNPSNKVIFYDTIKKIQNRFSIV